MSHICIFINKTYAFPGTEIRILFGILRNPFRSPRSADSLPTCGCRSTIFLKCWVYLREREKERERERERERDMEERFFTFLYYLFEYWDRKMRFTWTFGHEVFRGAKKESSVKDWFPYLIGSVLNRKRNKIGKSEFRDIHWNAKILSQWFRWLILRNCQREQFLYKKPLVVTSNTHCLISILWLFLLNSGEDSTALCPRFVYTINTFFCVFISLLVCNNVARRTAFFVENLQCNCLLWRTIIPLASYC